MESSRESGHLISLSVPPKPTQSPFFCGKSPINMVSLSPGAKGDVGEVSSFKRPAQGLGTPAVVCGQQSLPESDRQARPIGLKNILHSNRGRSDNQKRLTRELCKPEKQKKQGAAPRVPFLCCQRILPNILGRKALCTLCNKKGVFHISASRLSKVSSWRNG